MNHRYAAASPMAEWDEWSIIPTRLGHRHANDRRDDESRDRIVYSGGTRGCGHRVRMAARAARQPAPG